VEETVDGKAKANEFAQKLKALQTEYENDCELYAANVAMDN
jgi:hypothetical protein